MSIPYPVYPRRGSIPYAAAKIGCSIPTVYKLIREGKLRTYLIGRNRHTSDKAIDQCIELLERETRKKEQVA